MISKDNFFYLLQKRLTEYIPAIAGMSNSDGMYLHMAQVMHSNLQKMQALSSQVNLFGSDFWGYGINAICDGKETHSQHDVEVIKTINELNKHHSEYRAFWLLFFRVNEEALFVSIFCIDTVNPIINSNIDMKYDLSNFKNARIRTRQDRIFVDFSFKDIEKPIHFQIDNNVSKFGITPTQLAQFYVTQITSLVNQAKKNNYKGNNPTKTNSQLNQQIDEIELKLRNIIVKILVQKTGKEDFETLLSGQTKKEIKRRIQLYVKNNPNKKYDDFLSLKEAIQFSDISDLKSTILKDEYWQFFEIKFKDKTKVEKYFTQFTEIRNVVKHSREMTELIFVEGNASIIWLEMVIKA